MPQAPKPVDDAERVESLHKLNLLDTPLEHRFERITRMVCLMLNVPVSAFSLIDSERQWFKSIQGLHATENTLPESMCAYTILGDDVMVVPDAKKDQRFIDNPMVDGTNSDISFYAGCPVRAPDGRKIGSLCAIDMKPRDMKPEHIFVLRDLAQMIESELKVAQMAHTQAQLITELDTANRLALVDPLTRIWNRAGIEDVIRREWADHIRKDTPIALVMADIDHFKRVNDTYGHPVGDTVIQEVAKRLLLALRTEDAVGRVGGEELLIVLPGCPMENLFDTVERIRLSVVSEPIPTAAGHINITMSFGGSAETPTVLSQSSQMISVADEALYHAKKSGRNQTQLKHCVNIDLLPAQVN